MSIRATFNNDLNVAKRLSYLHNKYVVPADKASNNIVLVCKSHYIDCLTKELGIVTSLGNPAYTPTTLAKEEILDNHRSVFVLFCSFRTTKDEELDLPPPFLSKLQKCPYKQRSLAETPNCSTKLLSKLVTFQSSVKTGLQSYCDISYLQMWCE